MTTVLPLQRHHAGPDPVERVRAALAEVAAGRPVVLLDDEHGGDLVVAAELATAETVAFVIRHTAGFLCVAVPEEDADRLDLPLLVPAGGDRPAAAQCVAVDAAAGNGTGISATDRATTIRLLAGADTVADDLVRPGHVVPLRVRADGLLGRRGRAEAAADLAGLAGLAGLRPAAALCPLVSTVDPTRSARGWELEFFAREHGLRTVAISDLIAYRERFEQLVERGASAAMPLPEGRFTAVGYRSRRDGGEHLALVHGDVRHGDDVLVHVHRECLLGHTLGSLLCGCGGHLRSALADVAAEGRGVVVYLRSGADVIPDAARRDHVFVAQVLRDLGVGDARLVDGDPFRRCMTWDG